MSNVNVSNVPLADIPVRTTTTTAGKHIQHVLSDPGLDSSDALLPVTRIVVASATVTYIGKAVPGTATSTAGWQIKKIDTSSDTVISVADSGKFTQVFDDRASLTYA